MDKTANPIPPGVSREPGVLCDGQSAIHAWRCGGVVLEAHTGMPTALPRHAHDTYQIGITTRDPGEYLCEGRTWNAPPGSVILFHPGDVHSVVTVGVRNRRDTSLLMFVDPRQMQDIATSLRGVDCGLPVFDDLVIRDAAFIRRFADTHARTRAHANPLEQESRLLALLQCLVGGFSAGPIAPRPVARNRRKALLVRDYIDAHYRDTLSMAQLADVAHTSPYHLNRLFAREIGIPPHAYQTQLRVERAKRLLLRGTSITDAALSTGFFDQSHFTRYFKRIVGVPPRRYTSPAAWHPPRGQAG
ncbi:AraC family transcriptional regulator [Bordetella bronchiseptica]|uniref:AraC family transcriptional regulator n=1 Tax=Bordetella bronchiseptica TaxID=518 RepID=UPI000444E40A|nr:AraC family transcriptional regulator [Bordetella bronchiseptica]AWP80408.1 AraC family transcriptional regulator [Bordetella bronchiseptica]AWP85209.1 AraC family transcriptional regulator [Bordetella bronchiseptica]AWQ10784.1 AraC family transcriptional regulator [Bordetella bronchiseptica]AXT89424.1 AraC family transcriptional regulator [Bordetella bronchiseptica]KDB79479.1 DNA-binding helix-turn-helix protein [Bordetella bronchiseptica CARE970018BB]